jgi:hypothetical protein
MRVERAVVVAEHGLADQPSMKLPKLGILTGFAEKNPYMQNKSD